MSNKGKGNSLVIDYTKEFLISDKKDLMESCYFSIRGDNGDRCFKNSIGVIEDSDFDSLFPLISIVILTANKIECDSLNYIVSKEDDSKLKKRKHAIHIFKDSDLCAPDAYIFKMGSIYILHLNAYETGANTPGGSTDLVRFISNNPLIRPSCIISFGICYGRNPGVQDIGDVIIPPKLYPWSIGQKINENKFSIKHDNFNLWLEDKFSGSGIYSVLKNFCNGFDGRLITRTITLENGNGESRKNCNFSIKVMWGNMSTGEAVVSSQRAKKMIYEATKNDKEIGGEMEGYGIAKECIYYAKIPCFIIKAICDWGECKDIDKHLNDEKVPCLKNLKDQFQAYAAFCAGIALFQLLKEEKEKLMVLDIINWMGDSKRGKYCVKRFNYVEKGVFIKNLETYFTVDEKCANNILNIFVQNDIVKFDNMTNKYCINYEKF